MRTLTNDSDRHDVKFCGYRVPHPHTREIAISIQMRDGGRPCARALREAFVDLARVCDHVSDAFRTAVESGRTMPRGRA